MPTSRRTSSIVFESPVSSTPSTTICRLVLLEAVDAADQRRLAGARRPADDDALAARHSKGDVAQDVEVAEPFVDVLHFDVKHGCRPRSDRRGISR